MKFITKVVITALSVFVGLLILALPAHAVDPFYQVTVISYRCDGVYIASVSHINGQPVYAEEYKNRSVADEWELVNNWQKVALANNQYWDTIDVEQANPGLGCQAKEHLDKQAGKTEA